MWNEPTHDRLAKIPRLYETENIPLRDRLIFLSGDAIGTSLNMMVRIFSGAMPSSMKITRTRSGDISLSAN